MEDAVVEYAEGNTVGKKLSRFEGAGEFEANMEGGSVTASTVEAVLERIGPFSIVSAFD